MNTSTTRSPLYWKRNRFDFGVYANHPVCGPTFMGRTAEEAKAAAAETDWASTYVQSR